jgi:3-oxoacyl-[acyl-carrier protein] reductase
MWDDMVRVTLRSIFLCTRAVLPRMLQCGWGRIINISFAAAKAGVLGFTRSLAYEAARSGTTVNAICPGPIDTELFRNIPET